MPERPFLPVITGATASGKTACAVEVCRAISGEVVSADSMQVFRGMELLSAAPTEAEKRGIAHHMTGIRDPSEPFSVAAYRDLAVSAISDIFARGKQPVLCGGTGLYIDAVTRPMNFTEQADPKLRDELHAIADMPGGREKLHATLRAIDPQSAARLHQNDVRRVIRAIEVYRLTGETLTEQTRRTHAQKGDYNEAIFALNWPMEALYARINKRVDVMVNSGLLDEVRALMRASEDHPTAIQAIGYKEIAMALKGDIPLEEAVFLVKQATRNYAKRQMTWLRRDGRVIWLEAEGKSPAELAADIVNRIGDAKNGH